jgi:orotate phosphoribosyltransferase
MSLNENDILEIFNKSGALLKGHFLLTSGRHSGVYFQCAKVLQYPSYMELICANIAENFKELEFDTVISPAIGGIIVGQEVARQMGKKSIFAEREDKALVLRRGFTIEPGERFLVCEDVVTTGGSVYEVIDIIKNNGGVVAGIGFLVDRSNGVVNFGYPQYSTVSLNAISYPPDNCEICKENIPLEKPGSKKLKV